MKFEPVPHSLLIAVESVLYSLRNHPMSEDRVREQLNELHFLREAIARIDPTHCQAKSLASPFFPICAYKAIPLPDQVQLAEAGYLENPAKSSIDEVLPDRPSLSPRSSKSEAFYRERIQKASSRWRQKSAEQSR